jgi:hypothetical protein
MDAQDDAVCGAQEDSPPQEDSKHGERDTEGNIGVPKDVDDVVSRISSNCLRGQQKHTEQHHDETDKSTQQPLQIGSEDGREPRDAEQSCTRNAIAPTSSATPALPQGDHVTQVSSSPEAARNSLQELVKWPRAWRASSISGASQISLPLSDSTSVATVPPSKSSNANATTSLEQLQLQPEAIPLPQRNSKKKHDETSRNEEDFRWTWGGTKKKKKRKKTAAPPPPPPIMAETDIYRLKIDRLAAHLTNFENIATTATRHRWSPRIVYYDRFTTGRDHETRRYEPWESRSIAPSFEEFFGTLRNVSDECEQRIVLVEDLTPSLIDLLGATFQIPPHVFEEHLDRSGYKKDTEGRDGRATWHTHSSTQGYSSVTWYRPVLPLVPITSRLRSKLIMDRKPRVRCPFDGCQDRDHNLRLNTESNIWRRQLDLCPEPGVCHKGSDTEYPVGWEERATIWMRDYNGCRFGTACSTTHCVFKS